MTYQRLAYDDASSTSEMTLDCEAVESALRLPGRRTTGEQMTHATTRPAPSILFDDFPQDAGKPQITVSEAAARLGAGVHLHLD